MSKRAFPSGNKTTINLEKMLEIYLASSKPGDISDAAAGPSKNMRLLRASQVCELISCRKTTLYRVLADDPTFPRPIKPLGDASNIVAWWDYEILEYLANRPRVSIVTDRDGE